MRLALLLALLLSSALSGAQQLVVSPAARLLVKLRPGATMHLPPGASVSRELDAVGVSTLHLSGFSSPGAVAKQLARSKGVEWAEVDRLVAAEQLEARPNDPYYRNGTQWHLRKIEASTLWSDFTRGRSCFGDESILVAILDTGVNGEHEDLAARMVPGWNVNDNNADTRDVYGHGTMVAGCAVASTQNAVGIAAPSWHSRLMPVRISQANGSAYMSVIAQGLLWARDHGARVANISYVVTGSLTVGATAQAFVEAGGLVVTASGNSGGLSPYQDSQWMLTVAGTDALDRRAGFSTYGSCVDLCSPAVSIFTTNRGGGYSAGSGTSFASPIVAGVAAVVWSINPTLSPSVVEAILEDSSDDLGPVGWDEEFGAGRVNLFWAAVITPGE